MRGSSALVEKIKQQLATEEEKAAQAAKDANAETHSDPITNKAANAEPSEDDFVKIAFAFDYGHQFATPWITISAAKDNQFLTQIDIIFKYSGEDIKEVKYHEHCM